MEWWWRKIASERRRWRGERMKVTRQGIRRGECGAEEGGAGQRDTGEEEGKGEEGIWKISRDQR